MATEEFNKKDNTTPEGGWRFNVTDTRTYEITRAEAVHIINKLSSALGLPGGWLADFSVEDKGVTTCRVFLVLMPKDKDPSLRY